MTLILEKSKEIKDVENLKAEVRRVIRSSLGTRAKEDLVIDFINTTDLAALESPDDIIEAFYGFARIEKANKIGERVEEESLKGDSTRFIEKSISKGYGIRGDDLTVLFRQQRDGGRREKKKETVLDKIRKIVEVFVGI